ncbi:MAG: hypothetical protein U1F52_20260 [Burkholderiales bacterium]
MTTQAPAPLDPGEDDIRRLTDAEGATGDARGVLRADVSLCLALAGLLAVVAFLLEGTLGFNLADEGYLWYGAQRVLRGEIPLRDFQSYDPGRYYWSAFVMAVRGSDGLVSLWTSTAIFQAIGLAAALWGLRRWGRRSGLVWLLAAAMVLLLWMIPRHKAFDITVSIFQLVALAFLLERPEGRRWFLAGAVLGLSAVINRNHGAYGFMAHAAAFILSRRTGHEGASPRALGYWAAGLLVGYSPVWLMLLLVPGFAAAYWESIRYIVEVALESRNTNLPLPVPWPWRAPFGRGDAIIAWRACLIGVGFVSLIVFAGYGVWRIFDRRQGRGPSVALVTAAALLSLPYAHHAFSRAEVLHLAQGSFPLLLAGLVWLSHRGRGVRWAGYGVVLAASALVTVPAHPGYQRATEGNWVTVSVGGEVLSLNPGTASNVATFQGLHDRLAGDGGSFLAMPHWPGSYAMVRKPAPGWEIYSLFPSSPAAEHSELESVARADIRFVILQDVAVDGRDDLRFRNTHPLMQRYIDERFERVQSPFEDPTLATYVRRRSGA